jgi:hypothetical protein
MPAITTPQISANTEDELSRVISFEAGEEEAVALAEGPVVVGEVSAEEVVELVERLERPEEDAGLEEVLG